MPYLLTILLFDGLTLYCIVAGKFLEAGVCLVAVSSVFLSEISRNIRAIKERLEK